MKHAVPPIENPDVAAAFDAVPESVRGGLFDLRRLIFEVAAETPGVGRIEETLKWGQPAYLTPETKSGSTIRLGLPKEGGFAIYAHCQTTVISGFREMFAEDFTFDGNRAVLFGSEEVPDLERLRPLVLRALTYHLKRLG